ncbi:hypothetical protein LguiA_031026 [Lonicera macranthoides]
MASIRKKLIDPKYQPAEKIEEGKGEEHGLEEEGTRVLPQPTYPLPSKKKERSLSSLAKSPKYSDQNVGRTKAGSSSQVPALSIQEPAEKLEKQLERLCLPKAAQKKNKVGDYANSKTFFMSNVDLDCIWRKKVVADTIQLISGTPFVGVGTPGPVVKCKSSKGKAPIRVPEKCAEPTEVIIGLERQINPPAETASEPTPYNKPMVEGSSSRGAKIGSNEEEIIKSKGKGELIEETSKLVINIDEEDDEKREVCAPPVPEQPQKTRRGRPKKATLACEERVKVNKGKAVVDSASGDCEKIIAPIWLTLLASDNQDVNLTISYLKKYIMQKLVLESEDEAENGYRILNTLIHRKGNGEDKVVWNHSGIPSAKPVFKFLSRGE